MTGNGVKIRAAETRDIPSVMALLEETGFTDDDLPYNTPGYFKRSVNSGIFYVAQDAGEIIGMVHGEKLINDGAVIWYFAVAEKSRGKGVGHALICGFENHCKRAGIKWIFGSADRNDKTLKFYKDRGYKLSDTYVEFAKSL